MSYESAFIEFIQQAQCLVEHRSIHLFKQSENYFIKLRKQDSSIELCLQLLQFSTLPLTGMNIPIETVHLIASQTLSYVCSMKRLSSVSFLTLVRLVMRFANISFKSSRVYNHLKLALCQAILNDILVSAISNPGTNGSYDPDVFSLKLYCNNLSSALSDSSIDPFIWADILTSIPDQITTKEFSRFSKPMFSFPSALSREIFSHHLYHTNLPYIVNLIHDCLGHLQSTGQITTINNSSSSSGSAGSSISNSNSCMLVMYHDNRFTKLIECVQAWGEGYLHTVATHVLDPIESSQLRQNLYLLLTNSTTITTVTTPTITANLNANTSPNPCHSDIPSSDRITLLESVLGYLRATTQFSSMSEFMEASSCQCGNHSTAHYPATLELCQDLLRVLTLCVFGFWNNNNNNNNGKDSGEITLMPITTLRLLCNSDSCDNFFATATSVITMSVSMGCSVVMQMLPFLRSLLHDCHTRISVRAEATDAQDQSSVVNTLTTVSDTITPLFPWITVALLPLTMHTRTSEGHGFNGINKVVADGLQLFSLLLRDLLEMLSSYTNQVAILFTPLLIGQSGDFDTETFESYIDTLSTPIEIVSSIFSAYVYYTSAAVSLTSGLTSSLDHDFSSQVATSSCSLIELLVRVSAFPVCLHQPNSHHLQHFLVTPSSFSQIYEKFSIFRNDIRDFIRELTQNCLTGGSNPFVSFIVRCTITALDQSLKSIEHRQPNSDVLVLHLESQLHLCTSISRALCTDMASISVDSVSGTVTNTSSSSILENISTLLFLVARPVCISVAPLARLAVVLISDILPAYFDCTNRLNITHTSVIKSSEPSVNALTTVISNDENVHVMVADVCIRCAASVLSSLQYTESVTDDSKQLLTHINSYFHTFSQVQRQTLDPISIQLLPFRIKQDHIGAVAVLKLVDIFIALIKHDTFVAEEAMKKIANECVSQTSECSVLNFIVSLSQSTWAVLASSHYFWEPSPIIRVMTFKSFLLLHEASLSISTRTLILLCQCVGDPSVDPSNSFSHLFGTQLGPLCVATVTALSLLSQSAGIEKIIMACDDILTRVLDSNFPLHSDPDVVSVLRQKCIQRGIELVMPNCPSLVPAIQSRGYTALAELASSDANIAASVTTLITSDVPVLAIIRSIELLTQGLDIICASVTKQLRLSSDLTMAMSIQATFCRVNYHNCRRVWLPMIQLLLSLYDVAHRVALMPSICTLLEKVISSLAPVETPSGAQQAIADSTDLVILLTDALPQLSLDLVSIHLWSSPECLRVVTSLMITLLKWGASGVDLSSVVLQYFNQISERISTALCQLPIPASDATSADASLLIKTDLIFAYATDFWTACVSSTQLQYTYPTPSLNAIIPTNSVAPLTIPHISSTVPISYFKDYSHLISIIVESLGDYSVRRAYILSFCTQKMVDSNILDDLSAWDKMVALFASFVSKPSFEIFPYSEEALFTQYLKETFESTRLSRILRTLIFGLCGAIPSTQREGLIFVTYHIFELFTPDAAALALLPVMTEESAAWIYQVTVSSENSRQALAQQLRMHVLLGNIKQFKTSLKVLSRKK